MKRMNEIVVAMLVLGLGFIALAQGPSTGRNYDPKTEVTVKGTIEDVQEHVGKGGRQGVHFILKTDSGTLSVHVGPSAYIAKEQLSFAKGDAVEIVGSKVSMGGEETLLAREITKAGKTLALPPSPSAGPRDGLTFALLTITQAGCVWIRHCRYRAGMDPMRLLERWFRSRASQPISIAKPT